MALPRAQELNQRIIFKNTDFGGSAVGVPTIDSTYRSAWAKITEGGGSVDNEDMQHQSQTKIFEVVCRYDSGVTGFMAITWGTRTLSITGPPQKMVDRNGREWMVIEAEEATERSA